MPVVGSILKTTMRGLEKNVVSPMLKEAEQLLGPKIGLFSKLEQEVSRLNFTKMPAEQLRKTMTGRQVSPAETESVLGGLEGTVNREQVRDAIAMKGMKLEDVVLGEVKPMTVKETGSLSDREFRAQMNLESANATKFSSYQEPGAVPGSYREMFVTAPDINIDPRFKQLEEGLRNIDNMMLPGPDRIKSQEALRERLGFTKEELSNYFLNKDSISWQDGHSAYSDIQNPIVRIRFNEREVNDPRAFDEAAQDSFGKSFSQLTEKEKASLADVVPKKKKILFVEEIQGPSEANQAKMPEALRKRIYDIGTKRVLAYAKENGFDGVAWTTGKMQVDRYPGVSQVADKVKWEIKSPTINETPRKFIELSKGDKDVLSIMVDSDGIITASHDHRLVGKSLTETIGKEIAEKINTNNSGSLSGTELEIGGQGLKSLYDKTLPALFKKYGKEGVESLNISTEHPWNVYDASDNLIGSYKTKDLAYRMMNQAKMERGTDYRVEHVEDISGTKEGVSYIPITSKTPGRFPIYSVGPVGAIMKLLQEEKENKKNAQSTYHR